MTVAILPAKYDAAKTLHCLESLAGSGVGPRVTIVMCDEDKEICHAVRQLRLSNTELLVYYDDVHRGYWQTLNHALEVYNVSLHEPFIYLGNDVEFGPDWLSFAEACFRSAFLDSLGLLSFQDYLHGDFNASHGMLTRAWLYVLYGMPYFPREYWHYYEDAELTARSKSMERYVYCEKSVVAHKHVNPSGHLQYYRPSDLSGDTHMTNDYTLKERRGLEWLSGGLDEALRRMP